MSCWLQELVGCKPGARQGPHTTGEGSAKDGELKDTVLPPRLPAQGTSPPWERSGTATSITRTSFWSPSPRPSSGWRLGGLQGRGFQAVSFPEAAGFQPAESQARGLGRWEDRPASLSWSPTPQPDACTGLSARWEPEACPGDVLTREIFFLYFYFFVCVVISTGCHGSETKQSSHFPARRDASPVIPGRHLAAQHPPLRLR